MLSESARMSSAAEARFRIPAPPPTARAVTVIALDPASGDLVERLAQRPWTRTTFLPPPPVTRAGRAGGSDLGALDARLGGADLVVLVVAAGAEAPAAAPIGEACSDRGVTAATCVVGARGAGDEALSRTLAQVRPWSQMVVVANDDDYVEDILRSLR